jgi:hypothetical protein
MAFGSMGAREGKRWKEATPSLRGRKICAGRLEKEVLCSLVGDDTAT